MKNKKYIHTKFINYLWEKYNNTPEPEDEDDIDIPLPEDDEEDLPGLKKKFKPKELSIEEEEDEEDIEDTDDGEEEPLSDEEILEKLILEYKKLKKVYENKLQRRKRR